LKKITKWAIFRENRGICVKQPP